MTRTPIARLRDGIAGHLTLGALLAAGLVAAAGAAPPVPAAPVLAAQARVEAIARRLLLAHPGACAERRSDYGLVTGPATSSSWGAPLAVVWPDGPAAAAGLRPGDLIRTVDGVPWSADPIERQRFIAALVAAPRAGKVVLGIAHGAGLRAVALTGQPRCHVEVRVSAQPFINASATASTIVIGGGLERLLGDDAELAFAVAHEAAHVVLGHTAPDRRAAIGISDQRLALEREADAFALGLMSAAGYPASAAATAWIKIADASRPPLARLMDLHGPYMATAERTAFLTATAARLAAPASPRLPAARRSR